MEKRIENAVLINGMRSAYEKVIIGFSGGADSSALLHYFSKRAKDVVCVHVNHMIRGAEADRDEGFCREACKKYGIELVCHKIDIPRLARESGRGLEETARGERYRVFYEELEKRGFDAILTAHNANDNAESVIFNLVRGSGANGLCGIKPVNGKILRPLIYASKKEILLYCEKNGIEYVTDSTNTDTDYTRNYIRHTVIPALERINPSLNGAIERLTVSLRTDEEYLNSEAEKFVSLMCRDKKIRPRDFENCPDCIKIRVLKLLCGENIDYKSVTACLEFIKSSTCGGVINLCKGVSLKRESDYLIFIKTAELSKTEFSLPLKIGLNKIEATGETVSLACDTVPEGSELYFEARIKSEAVSGNLYVRSRMDGDIIKHGKITKKLKKLMCERKIPSHLRDKLPLVCDGNGILVAPKVAVRDGALEKDSKNKDVILRFYRRKGD